MRSHFDSRPDSQQLADLKNQTEELERKLSDARLSLERELAQSSSGRAAGAGPVAPDRALGAGRDDRRPDGGGRWDPYAEPEPRSTTAMPTRLAGPCPVRTAPRSS